MLKNTNLKVSKYIIYLVVILGHYNVGKTSIIKCLENNEFKQEQATVGVEFSEYNVDYIDPNTDNKLIISLQIWDTCKNLLKQI